MTWDWSLSCASLSPVYPVEAQDPGEGSSPAWFCSPSSRSGFQIVNDDRVSRLKNKYWVLRKPTTLQRLSGFFMWPCDRKGRQGIFTLPGCPLFQMSMSV